MVYIILTAPVAYPARSERLASSYWQPSNHSGCFIFITAIRFFLQCILQETFYMSFRRFHVFLLWFGIFVFIFTSSDLYRCFTWRKKYTIQTKTIRTHQFFIPQILYYALLFLPVLSSCNPGLLLYAWMCGKQNVKSSFIFLIAFTQQFSSLILHRP